MFDLINGLPIHPLVVHAVVVLLLPLEILGAIALALKPAWRLTYGYLVLAAGVVATALIPVATSSGEQLEKHVGDPGEHAEMGDLLIWFALPLLVLVAAMVLLERRRATSAEVTAADGSAAAPSSGLGSPAMRTTVAVLAVVAALAAGFQVYRVGDSGARAAWGDQVGSSDG